MQHQIARITIPEGVSFADLRLARDPNGDVTFDWAPIAKICQASNLPIELLRGAPEDNVSGLLVQWYDAHIAQGGARDPVADDLIGEVQAEYEAGQAVSHQPGRA